MKIIYLVISGMIVSVGVSAHQISSDGSYNHSWNWNKSNHGTTEVQTAQKVREVKKKVTKYRYDKPTQPQRVSRTTSTGPVIQGIKGLDAIAQVGECYTTAYVEERCSDGVKKVMISPAREVKEVIPAITKKVTEKVMISPQRTAEEFVPALYKNIGKKVMISPERSVWKKGNFNAVQKTVNGETYCLVVEPAKYESRIEKVLQVPATTKTRTIPAVYKNYERTVVVTPAQTRVVETIPAVYATVSACVDKKAGHYEWRSVLCEQNATSDVLANIERKLVSSGNLSSSKVDGVIDDDTVQALKAYQRQVGLPVDGLVNIETVKSMGVEY